MLDISRIYKFKIVHHDIQTGISLYIVANFRQSSIGKRIVLIDEYNILTFGNTHSCVSCAPLTFVNSMVNKR